MTNFDNYIETLNNLANSSLSLAEYPENYRNNNFFIFNYFSTKIGNMKDYQLIPKELLSDPFFVASSLKLNPDIYLLSDPRLQNKENYEFLEKTHPFTVLRYASQEKLNDIYYCTRFVNLGYKNYQYLPNNIKQDKGIIEAFLHRGSNNDQRSLEEEELLKVFSKLIPKALRENDEYINNILKCQCTFYPYVTEKYKADFDLSLKMVHLQPSNFKSVSNILLNNDNFIEQVFNQTRKSDFHHIIPHMPIKYFTTEFCEKYQSHIHHNLELFSKEHRKYQPIILAAFSYDYHRDEYDCSNNTVKTQSYIDNIADDSVRGAVKAFVKINKTGNKHVELQSDIVHIIKNHHLKTKLEQMPDNSSTRKTNRIKI